MICKNFVIFPAIVILDCCFRQQVQCEQHRKLASEVKKLNNGIIWETS